MLLKKVFRALISNYFWGLTAFVLILFNIESTFAQNPIDHPSTSIQKLTEEEKTWISNHPVIRVSNNTSYAPIDFVSSGQPTGFSIDYLNLIATKVGFRIEYEKGNTLSHNLEMLKNKQLDIIHSISVNEERSRYFNFSQPYLKVPIVNYGHAGSPKINNINDLINKTIGVIKDTILHDAYKKLYPQFNLVEFNNVPDALRALSSSKIDVYTGTLIGTDYLIQQTSIPGLMVIGEDYILGDKSAFEHRMASHLDNPILIKIINKGMTAITNAEIGQIYKKWQISSPYDYALDLTPQELKWLARNKVIKVGIDQTATPLEAINENDEIEGILGDFLNILAKKLNITFVWSANNNFAEGIKKTISGETHIISVFRSPEREKELILTEPYFYASQMIFAREDRGVVGNMQGLSNNTLVQIKGYTVNNWVKSNYPNIKIVTVDTIPQAIKMLSAGKVDAFIGNIITTSHYIAQGGYVNINVIGDTNFESDLVIGISKKFPELGSALKKALNSITEAEKAEIATNWLTLKVENKLDYTLIIAIVIISIIVISIILIWNTTLRREVSRRILIERKLKASQREAEDANAAKSVFLASMSHDLRTPLNAIIGFSEVMKDELYGSINNEKYKEYNRDIHSSGEYLLQLVNDILDISALEAGEKVLQYEALDFGVLAQECQCLVHKLAEDKNIQCILNISEDTPPIYSDRQALMQILMNLVSNAIKFSNPNSIVTISDRVSGNSYYIEVSDTGIGISEEDIGTIAEPFTRANNSPHISHSEGTGLGLSIVKALVGLHKGTFNINSILDEGTTVTISLPLEKN